MKETPTPVVTLAPVAPLRGICPFTAGGRVSAAAWWQSTALPGSLLWSLPRKTALPNGVTKSLSAPVIPIE